MTLKRREEIQQSIRSARFDTDTNITRLKYLTECLMEIDALNNIIQQNLRDQLRVQNQQVSLIADLNSRLVTIKKAVNLEGMNI